MEVASAFSDLGVDAVTGTLLMESLGLSPDELKSPERFHKLKATIEFLKDYSEDTQRFLINKATRGKLVDKLDHMFGYTNILKEKVAREKVLAEIEKEIAVREGTDDVYLLAALQGNHAKERDHLDALEEELRYFEK